MELAFVLLLPTLMTVSCQNISDSSLPEQKSLFDRISRRMLSSWTFPEASRSKRSLPYESSAVDAGVYRLQSVKPVASLCSPAVRTLFLDVLNDTYAVCLRDMAYGETPAVVIGLYKDHAWEPKHTVPVFEPTDVAAFYWKGTIYVLVAENYNTKGIKLLEVNLETGEVKSEYTAPNSHPTSVAVWKMKDTYAMAGASSVGYRDSPDSSSEVLIYVWKDTYFDISAKVPAYYVTDLEPFQVRDFAFLAVSNFQRGKLLPDVDSEIFKFDIDQSTWKSFQKIKTYGAMDWEFFTLGAGYEQEFFLAVANRNGDLTGNSMIYKFVEDKFQPFQCLLTAKANSIASYSEGSTFMLAVANEDDAVHLYQYDGWTFIKSVQRSSGAMSYGAVHLKFHQVMRSSQSAVVLSVSNPKHPNDLSVLEMVFLYESGLKQWHEDATEWCYSALSKAELSDIDKSIGDFEDVIFVDQPVITVDGDVTFDHGFEVETLETPKLSVKISEEVYDETILINLSGLQKRLSDLKEKLKRFVEILSRSLKIDGSQTVSSRIEFQDIVFDFKNLNSRFPNMFTNKLNGEDITDWAHQLIFTDSDQPINGTLYFSEINAPSLNVLGSVDGRPVSSLVTKSGRHTITAKKVFESSISVPDLRVKGSVDGIEVSSNSILLTTGYQKVTGNIVFEDVHTQWLKVSTVNERNFDNFYNDLVFADRPAVITGVKEFGSVSVTDLEMKPGAEINGVDVIDLWQNVLWKNGHQNVIAPMILTDAIVEKNLFLSQGLNGIDIPGPRVIDVTGNAVVTSPVTFDGNTNIKHLEVLESLNNMPLVEGPDGQKQLDLLLRTGKQVVSGVKTFHSLHLDADSSVDGKVDGVKLSHLKDMVLSQDPSRVTNSTWVFQNLIVKGPITVKNLVSGYNLDDIYNRALKIDETKIPKMTFSEKIFVEELTSHNINEVDVSSDLVLRNEPQTIYGIKHFSQVVIKEDLIVEGLLNNMNLSFFNEYVLRLGNQHIRSKVFKGNIQLSNLIVNGLINGLPFTDAATLKGGHLAGSRHLGNVSFAKIEAKNVELTGTVNGIVLKNMIADTLTKEGAQTITGRKAFRNILVTDGSNLVAKSLNGIDLDELWADAVFLDGTQPVLGAKTFKGPVEFQDLYFDSTLDGVSEWDMRYNWMLQNSTQTVQGSVTFSVGFSGNYLLVGELNGHDLESLLSNIAMLNSENVIKGPVIFENLVKSSKDINLSGKIQGVDLSEEIVSRDNVVLAGKKKLHGLVVNDLGVDGKINGILIEELCNNAILDSTALNASRLVIRGDIMLMKGGTVSSHLAGVDLKLLNEIAVRTNENSPLRFSGFKKFSDVIFEGPVVIKGKMGGVNFDELVGSYMSLTRDQTINPRMVFHQLSADSIYVADLNLHQHKINGINIKEIDERVLKTVGHQNITSNFHVDQVIFENDVFVAGNVNDLKLPGALMVHNRINYIQSPKMFEKPLLVLGDLELDHGATLQGIDVDAWFRKSVLKEGKFSIQGSKTFQSLDLTDVIAHKLIDGLAISEESLFLTYGPQYVTGHKTISGDVSMERLTVDGLINEVNLTELSSKTLQSNRKNTITGSKLFSKPLTIVSLQAPTITGVDLMKIPDKLNESRNFLNLENRLDEIEDVVSHMKDAFNSQAAIFQYYELHEDAGFSAASWIHVSGKDCGEFLLLLESSLQSLCSTVRFFEFDPKLKNFVLSDRKLTTPSQSLIKYLSYRGTTYIFVTNQNVHSDCSNADYVGKETVDIHAWNQDSFKLIQSIVVDKPVDLVVFNSNLQACFAVSDFKGTSVYCHSSDSQQFKLQEILSTPGAEKAAVIGSAGSIVLAVVSSSSQVYLEGQKRVDVYMWDSVKSTFADPVQLISSTFIQSVVLMQHKSKRGEMLFLAVAEGNVGEILNVPKIIIYKYEVAAKQFRKYQVIQEHGMLESVVLNNGELLLFALNVDRGFINVFQYKGASGFVKMHGLRSPGTTSLHVFIRPTSEDWLHHYLALAGDNTAKLLKSRVKGNPPIN